MNKEYKACIKIDSVSFEEQTRLAPKTNKILEVWVNCTIKSTIELEALGSIFKKEISNTVRVDDIDFLNKLIQFNFVENCMPTILENKNYIQP